MRSAKGNTIKKSSKEKKEIVFVSNVYYPILGGISTYIKNLSHFLEKKGYKTSVVAYPHWLIYFEDRIKVKSLNRLFHGFAVALFIFYVLLIALKFRMKGKEIVLHSINASFCAVASGLAGSMFGCKCIHTLLSDLSRDVRTETKYNKGMFRIKIFDVYLNKMSSITFVSSYLRTVFEKRVQTLSADKNVVIYNSIDIDKFRIDLNGRKIIDKYSLRHPVFLFMGHLVKYKGPVNFIKVLNRLDKENVKFSAVMIGKGPLEDEVKQYIAENKLGKKIHLLSDIPDKDIPYFHASADIFVLPSLSEGLPTVVLETMACRTAVIATKIAGIPEVIKNNENGILIDLNKTPELTGELYNSVKRALENDRYKIYGKMGSKTVMDNFSWQSNVDKFIELYN